MFGILARLRRSRDHRPRVLFVEPDTELPEKAQALLPEFSFEVVTTAADAWTRINRDAPDAIVVADPLPDGDACEIAEKLRGRIPVLLTPTWSDDEPPERAHRRLVAAEVRVKSYSLWMLRQWLSDVTGVAMPSWESMESKVDEFKLVWKTIKAKWAHVDPGERLHLDVLDLRTGATRRHIYSKQVGRVALSSDEQGDIALDVPELGDLQIGLQPRDDKLHLYFFTPLYEPRPLGDLAIFHNDRPLSPKSAALLKCGDRLRVNHVQIEVSWEGTLGSPLQVADWILPSDPATRARGCFAIARLKSNSTVEPNVLLVREAGEWHVGLVMWIGFDAPRPDALSAPTNADVVVFWHGYGLAFTLDGGRTFHGAGRKLACSRLGPYIRPDLFIADGELIFAASEPDLSQFLPDRSPPTPQWYRLALEPGAEPIAIDGPVEAPTERETSEVLDPLRVDGARLMHRRDGRWQEVPAVDLIRRHAEENNLQL